MNPDSALRQELLLLVDDVPANLRTLEKILVEHYRLKLTTSGAAAIQLANREETPDLILLDLYMPDLDGLAVLAQLRAGERTKEIPVIFVTAEESVLTESAGINLGADDYVIKPVAAPVLLARVRGILRRRAAEASLKQSEEQFRSLYATMTQGVVYHDAQGRILHANPAALQILGVTPDRLQGAQALAPWPFVHRDGAPFPVDMHPTTVALATGQPVKEVLMGMQHPGRKTQIWIQVSAIPRCDPTTGRPCGLFTTFTDVTPQVVLEQQQALFLRMLNHEVRTPLAIMDSNCQLLALEQTGERGPALAAIRAAVAKVAELFDRCLTQDRLAAIGTLTLAPVNLEQLLNAVSQEAQRGTNDHLIMLRLDSPLPAHFVGDATLLRILLGNLLDNAVRYSPDGGAIELVAQTDGLGQVVIEVCDEGIGIPESEREQIFDRYHRTHQVHDKMGVGLGLYIVRNIARLHGGEVHCTSTLDEGSAFRVTLPSPLRPGEPGV
ncbi:MAG: response regulator [Magnetococcales bacterium]|nr:response regulator [Magnetococcales bacterium]